MQKLYVFFLVFAAGVSASFDLTCPIESPCCADSFSNSELSESADVLYGTATDLDGNAVVDLFMDTYEVCPFPRFVFFVFKCFGVGMRLKQAKAGNSDARAPEAGDDRGARRRVPADADEAHPEHSRRVPRVGAARLPCSGCRVPPLVFSESFPCVLYWLCVDYSVDCGG